jgi:predicted ribosome quality control (RQC) complex YloA/Tae2 family protein
LTVTQGEQALLLAARLTARYSQGRDAEQVEVSIIRKKNREQVSVTPFPAHEIPEEWLV